MGNVYSGVLITFSNEVHRKTDTLFPGNNTTTAKLGTTDAIDHSIRRLKL